MINRTSEDIDLRIDPSVGVVWEVVANDQEQAEETRKDYFDNLLESVSPFINPPIYLYFYVM